MLTVITPHNSSISAKKISQIKTGGFIILNISFPQSNFNYSSKLEIKSWNPQTQYGIAKSKNITEDIRGGRINLKDLDTIYQGEIVNFHVSDILDYSDEDY